MSPIEEHADPLAIIANLGRNIALADNLGDIREDIARAWKLAGLGDIPEAEGGEPREEGCGTHECGDIMIDEVTRVHGVAGLWRKVEYEVTIKWCDDWGEWHRFNEDVIADSPMDAARVAYHFACHSNGVISLGHADAEVDGARFEVEPVTCVRVTE